MSESRSRPSAMVDAVMIRSHGRWDRQIVLGLVNESLEAFDRAPVRQFIEVLVVKGVTDELRTLDSNHVSSVGGP